jgi:hypothetical protein
MTARAESIVDEIVAAYDFSPFSRIVDVGGGAGVLLSRILEVHSASTGILYDTAAVTRKASAYLARRGLSGRAEVIAGDFFAAVPRGDLLVLEAILHDWDDERAALILRQCRKALEPTGRILIIEDILEDILPGKVDGALIETDLLMLVCHNGQERTLAEYEELLVREGFRLESVGETGSDYKLITASAVPEKLCQDARPPAPGKPRPCGSRRTGFVGRDAGAYIRSLKGELLSSMSFPISGGRSACRRAVPARRAGRAASPGRPAAPAEPRAGGEQHQDDEKKTFHQSQVALLTRMLTTGLDAPGLAWTRRPPGVLLNWAGCEIWTAVGMSPLTRNA